MSEIGQGIKPVYLLGSSQLARQEVYGFTEKGAECFRWIDYNGNNQVDLEDAYVIVTPENNWTQPLNDTFLKTESSDKYSILISVVEEELLKQLW
ncbi:MAG: hypothetical protein Q7T11_04290, partial [Deltaproteobacteria bacterium]|nr:hypothetical protein [Deltaproteobacteria bacterium]